MGGCPIVLLGRGPVIALKMEKGQDVQCGVKFHSRKPRREDSHFATRRKEEASSWDIAEPKAVSAVCTEPQSLPLHLAGH